MSSPGWRVHGGDDTGWLVFVPVNYRKALIIDKMRMKHGNNRPFSAPIIRSMPRQALEMVCPHVCSFYFVAIMAQKRIRQSQTINSHQTQEDKQRM